MIDKKTTKHLNKLLKDGVFQFNRKNTGASKKLFVKVISDDPTNPEANYYLGLIYSKESNWKKAVLHLKTVVEYWRKLSFHDSMQNDLRLYLFLQQGL